MDQTTSPHLTADVWRSLAPVRPFGGSIARRAGVVALGAATAIAAGGLLVPVLTMNGSGASGTISREPVTGEVASVAYESVWVANSSLRPWEITAVDVPGRTVLGAEVVVDDPFDGPLPDEVLASEGRAFAPLTLAPGEEASVLVVFESPAPADCAAGEEPEGFPVRIEVDTVVGGRWLTIGTARADCFSR